MLKYNKFYIIPNINRKTKYCNIFVSRITPSRIGKILGNDSFDHRSPERFSYDMITGYKEDRDESAIKRIQHGKDHEETNRKLYEIKNNVTIYKPDFLVSNDSEWFGCEVDGFIFEKDQTEFNLDKSDKLFEAKVTTRISDKILEYEARRKEGFVSDEDMRIGHIFKPYIDQIYMEMWLTGINITVLSILQIPFETKLNITDFRLEDLPEDCHLFNQKIYLNYDDWNASLEKINTFCNNIYFPMIEAYSKRFS